MMGSFEARFRCQSIGSLLAKAGIADTRGWRDGLEWTAISRALASIARGRVTVILGQTYKPNGVWNTIELPVLRASKGRGLVTSIDRYTMIEENGKLAGPLQL